MASLHGIRAATSAAPPLCAAQTLTLTLVLLALLMLILGLPLRTLAMLLLILWGCGHNGRNGEFSGCGGGCTAQAKSGQRHPEQRKPRRNLGRFRPRAQSGPFAVFWIS